MGTRTGYAALAKQQMTERSDGHAGETRPA